MPLPRRRGRRFALNAARLMTTHRRRLPILKNCRAISCDAREKGVRTRAASHSAFRADRFGGSDAPPDAARGRATSEARDIL